jgi:uncharacterized membrane protein
MLRHIVPILYHSFAFVHARSGEGSVAYLICGLVLFFGVHSLAIVSPTLRDDIAVRIGAGAWRGLYSVLALGGLVLIVYGYGEARQSPTVLYVSPYWLRYVTVIGMVFVFPLLFSAYLPGRIQAKMKHPMLAAVKLWATLHLLVNGSVADIVLFGAFLAWAVADRISLKRRQRNRIVAAAAPSKMNDVIAVVAGLGVYAVFVLGAHQWLFGVPVLAGLP